MRVCVCVCVSLLSPPPKTGSTSSLATLTPLLPQTVIARLEEVVSKPFARMTYTEVLELITQPNHVSCPARFHHMYMREGCAFAHCACVRVICACLVSVEACQV